MTAGGMDASRAVQTVAIDSVGDRWFGSGYVVATGLVLTACHVLHGAASASVRFVDSPGRVREVAADVVFANARADVAVLRLRDAGPDVARAVFGYVAESVTCGALGFPRFKLNDDHRAAGVRPGETSGQSWYRDSHHAIGTCNPGSNRYTGTLELTVPAPDRDRRPDRSPWEGMSGAAVFADGLLIGVVAEHHRWEGLGRLTAGAVKQWPHLLDSTSWQRLQELLGSGVAALVATGTTDDPGLVSGGGVPPAMSATNTGNVVQNTAAGAAAYANTGIHIGDVTVSAAGRDRESLVRAVLLPNTSPLPRGPVDGRVAPSFLLRSQFTIIPFQGRDRELEDLSAWCLQDEDPIGIRLCVAPGGQGKTRLAQQLGIELERHGWLAGRLRTRYDQSDLAQLLEIATDMLLVVDYAETAPSTVHDIAELLTHPTPSGARRRLLLLARSGAGWWEMLRGRLPDEIAVRAYAPPYELAPLFDDPTDRAPQFQAAVRKFAHDGGYPVHDVTPPHDLAEDRFGHALTLHMTALAALLDRNNAASSDIHAAPTHVDPAARVLDHERHYWSEAAAASGLPDTQMRVLDAVMFMATCATADTREEAVSLLACLRDLAGEHDRILGQYADWAHQLQPGEHWLNPLEPDLLGESFIARTLQQQPDLTEAVASAVATVEQHMTAVLTFSRVAGRYSEFASTLTDLLRSGSDKLWLSGIAIVPYLPEPDVLTGPLRESLDERDPATLWVASRELPGSYRVSDLKTAVATEALRRYEALPERNDAAEADLLDGIAEGLYYADRFDEAEEMMPRLLKRLSGLVAQDPVRYTHAMIRAEISYGRILLGQDNTKALNQAKRAKNLAAGLPAADRAQPLSAAHDLHAQALSRRREAGDLANAVLEAQKAVQQGAIAARTSEQARQWQPMLVMNLANRYSDVGKKDEQALDAATDAVQQLRELANRHVDPLWPNMILALYNYAQCLRACGRIPEARQAIADAASRARRLARRRPHFRRHVLITARSWLSYLSQCTANDRQVCGEYEQIIDMLAEFAAADPDAATVQENAMLDYAVALARAGDHAAARRWRNEADRFLPDTTSTAIDTDTLRRARDLMREIGVDGVRVRSPSGDVMVVGPDPERNAPGGEPVVDRFREN